MEPKVARLYHLAEHGTCYQDIITPMINANAVLQSNIVLIQQKQVCQLYYVDIMISYMVRCQRRGFLTVLKAAFLQNYVIVWTICVF